MKDGDSHAYPLIYNREAQRHTSPYFKSSSQPQKPDVLKPGLKIVFVPPFGCWKASFEMEMQVLRGLGAVLLVI